jgi:hypothetical protein
MLANFNFGVFILEPKPLTHAQVESRRFILRAPAPSNIATLIGKETCRCGRW